MGDPPVESPGGGLLPLLLEGVSARGAFLAAGVLAALALALRESRGDPGRRSLLLDAALPLMAVLALSYAALHQLRVRLGEPAWLPPEAPFLLCATAGIALVPLLASLRGIGRGEFADVLAAPAALALVFWHAGAFLSGWGFGAPSALPWGTRFAGIGMEGGIPRHPVQIYLAVLAAALCLLLRRAPGTGGPGARAFLLGSLYGYGYFLLSFFRADGTARYLGGTLSLTQAASAVVGLVCSSAFVARAGPPAAPPSPRAALRS